MAQPRIITPEFRAVWCSIMRPAEGMNHKAGDKLKYSLKAAFPPTADLSQLKAQANAAASEFFGSKLAEEKFVKSLNPTFRRNDDLDNPIEGIGDDWMIVTFSAKEDRFSPSRNLVDSQNNGIMNEVEVYSGAWFKVQTNAYGYDKAGNRGVAFGLVNVQKTRDDDPIGNAPPAANKAFEAVAAAGPQGAPKNAANIFG